jgi:hypothetical protein
MSIRAKFLCASLTKDMAGNESVELYAANGKNGSTNAHWAKMTPGGNLRLTISNPDAQGRLTPGKYYFLDIAETTEEA